MHEPPRALAVDGLRAPQVGCSAHRGSVRMGLLKRPSFHLVDLAGYTLGHPPSLLSSSFKVSLFPFDSNEVGFPQGRLILIILFDFCVVVRCP
ncbi:hypothetical protein IMZ48_17925 [Candidatus Bathyarchaeota archaeon]|nr:hypothetical protein [Candidatus Bathyarchaeota archaeon]